MIYVENSEFLKETNKIHQQIVAVEAEYELRREVLYISLAAYLKRYAPKTLNDLINPPRQMA